MVFMEISGRGKEGTGKREEYVFSVTVVERASAQIWIEGLRIYNRRRA